MEKVKIFSCGFGADNSPEPLLQLESKINDWIKKSGPAIVERTMAVASGINAMGNTFLNCTIVIFYHGK